jgi:ribonucleoside-diphosphate reductase alpha chain
MLNAKAAAAMSNVMEGAARRKLSNRRASITFNFQCNSLGYSATISHYPDGRLAEVFINNSKVGSDSDSAAKDSAVVCSLALQHGVPLATIRKALLRDPRGIASSPLGVALDLIAGSSCS